MVTMDTLSTGTLMHRTPDGFYTLILSDGEYERINAISGTANRAVELATSYIPHIIEDVRDARDVQSRRAGYDVEATYNSGVTLLVEVKGSKGSSLLGGLIVNSQQEYDVLVSGDALLLRILNVGQQLVRLRFLRYGTDYVLIEEPRWRAGRPR